MEGLDQLRDAVSNQGGQRDAGDAEAKRAQEEQMRRDLMTTVLDAAARERRMSAKFSAYAPTDAMPGTLDAVSRIALVSPERSKQIEGILLRMAQSGQLRGKVTENQLIELLEQMEEVQGKATAKKSTIVYQRRKDVDDDFDI
ncbi:hypothetical protein DXG03_002682 [Asterophora parasitica]|uniref:Programmed cell death protein 5 n=1 Tax=Asterophora parasitica TaxID=117018 RepID=A0A9P7GGP0_9AGAR|nr:hypothetical protein DXG03_002682 [Asterophora parasitica]